LVTVVVSVAVPVVVTLIAIFVAIQRPTGVSAMAKTRFFALSLPLVSRPFAYTIEQAFLPIRRREKCQIGGILYDG
jgi:hypothetical protein